VFENRVLQRIFRHRREEVVGCWRLHNREIRNLYNSPYVIRVIKSRSVRWVGSNEKCMQYFGWKICWEETI